VISSKEQRFSVLGFGRSNCTVLPTENNDALYRATLLSCYIIDSSGESEIILELPLCITRSMIFDKAIDRLLHITLIR
jgi:hypothetical protein